MLVTDLLREGRLAEALAQSQQDVRKSPENAKHRVFLFQLLAVMGAWDRAANQLTVIGELDAQALPMVQTYGPVLNCEVFRSKVFSGDKAPLIFGDPEEWIAHLLEALRLTARGKHAEANALRESALDRAPATAGEFDGKPFEWIADADSRLGPVCEAILNGKYYWIPFHRLRTVVIEPPADLRDCVWMPAKLTFANGGESVAFIPTRYPGSENHADGFIQLARKTEWNEASGDVFLGAGQRILATDTGEFSIMDTRRIDLQSGIDEGAS
jgi:type VI secretion system protein ImpE